MNYNICVVIPSGYIHSAAFFELAELLGHGLKDLGHNVAINSNQTFHDARNIIVGSHLLDPSLIGGVPESSIVLNTEQISDDDTAWNSNIFSWVSRFETWDYSEKNLLKLQEIGAKNPKLLQIGFHDKLARIPIAPEQDIDVLFYGSVNERRKKVLDELSAAGCKVKAVFGVYGEARDALIARSKVVLNMHFYKSKIFEIVRAFYLMTNSKAVVSEVGKDTSIAPCYVDGLLPACYEDLVESCKRLLADDSLRREHETKAFDTIRKLPQHELLKPLLV